MKSLFGAGIFVALGSFGCAVDESVSSIDSGADLVGPESEIELVIDSDGVSHVYAQSDSDAFFGGGYAVAKDRPLQLELLRRLARGTAAEIFGDGVTERDIFARAMRFVKYGEADAEAVVAANPEDAALMQAWVSGINFRLYEMENDASIAPYVAETLGGIPEAWTLGEIYAIGKMLSFGQSNTLSAEILSSVLTRFSPDLVEQLPLLVPAYDTFILGDDVNTSATSAKVSSWTELAKAPELPYYRDIFHNYAFHSNNWAIDGAHSENGMPWIANDPHEGVSSPSDFWPIHLNSVDAGGSLDVAGFGFVGVPGVLLGHNAYIGWTATTNFADVMDLWDVSIGDTDTSIELGGTTYEIERHEEVITIRDEDGSSHTKTVSLIEVPDAGIVVPEDILPVPSAFVADGQILMNWAGFAPSANSAYLALNRATSMDEFESAVDLLDVGAVNFIAADRNEIGYHVHANIPDRGDPSSRPMPWRIMSQDDDTSFWTGTFLSSDKLPHWRAPDRGYLSSANNDPFGFTQDGDVENDPYYYGAFYSSGFRAHRVDELVSSLVAESDSVGLDDMESIQQDVYSGMADTLIPWLELSWEEAQEDPQYADIVADSDVQELVERLLAWDRRFDRTTSDPILFFAFEWIAAKQTFEEPIGSLLFYAVAALQPEYIMAMLRNVVEDRFPYADLYIPDGVTPLMIETLSETATWAREKYGSVESVPLMEEVFFAEFPSLLGDTYEPERAAVNGCFDTVSVAEVSLYESSGNISEEFIPHKMSSFRIIMHFDDDGSPVAEYSFYNGTSEDPTSEHFVDQQSTWANGEYKPLLTKRSDVDAVAEETMTISPIE